MDIIIGLSKRDKEYFISKTIVYQWLIDNKSRQIIRHYNRSGSVDTLFEWLSDRLEISYYDLDLDNNKIVIDLGFMKIKTGLRLQLIR